MGIITFCKIPNEEGTKFYNIKAEWLLQEFSISILHNASAWKGVVDSSEIKQLSKEHNTTADEYMKECQVAFSGDGPEKFVYSLKNMGESAIVLTWKKTVASDIKIKFGSVCLRPEPLDRFMDEVWNVLENMSEELTQAKKATEEVEREKGMLFDRVKEYQELKLEMEKTLYAKFVLILNAKKKKIQELETQLEERACTHRTGGVEAPEDRVKSEPPAREEVERRKEPVARTRKNATRGRGGRSARGKPAAGSPRKAVEVISPLDILPPFQQPKEEEVGHGESGYNPGYDSDTEVDEPGPATSTTFRSNYNNDRRETAAAAAAEVKAELPEPDSGSPSWDMVDDPPTPERDYSDQKNKIGAPSPTRRSDSSSSTDIDEFLAQDDPLPLSTLPKRSRRTAANSWATTQSTSRVVLPAAAPPAASTAKVDAHVFSTQDLLDDL